mmetsp:Transcript_10648/g.42936  ORF Transcript_10648/g.42936 Transcript_10648/m.42936 type:complete len:379 (+) Transcript_10648:873-2009(+)
MSYSDASTRLRLGLHWSEGQVLDHRFRRRVLLTLLCPEDLRVWSLAVPDHPQAPARRLHHTEGTRLSGFRQHGALHHHEVRPVVVRVETALVLVPGNDRRDVFTPPLVLHGVEHVLVVPDESAAASVRRRFRVNQEMGEHDDPLIVRLGFAQLTLEPFELFLTHASVERHPPVAQPLEPLEVRKRPAHPLRLNHLGVIRHPLVHVRVVFPEQLERVHVQALLPAIAVYADIVRVEHHDPPTGRGRPAEEEAPLVVRALEWQGATLRGHPFPELRGGEVVQLVVADGEHPVFALAPAENSHHPSELLEPLSLGLELILGEVERALVIDDVPVVQHEGEVALVEVVDRVTRDREGVPVSPPLRAGVVATIVHVGVLDVRQ